MIGRIAAGVILFLALIMLLICTTKVPAGYVAVQYNMNGGVRDKVLTQGWHLHSPTTKTTLYTIGLEQSYLTVDKKGDSPDDESYTASTKEGKAITVQLAFNYQYNAEDVTAVFNKFKGQSGEAVRDSFIKPNIVAWSKEVIARYSVTDLVGEKRSECNAALTEYISEKFAPYGITVTNVNLADIGLDEDTEKAINAKITAQQNAETQAITNQTNVDKATAEAEAARIAAQGNADAQLIEAQAEAKANELLRQSLSQEVLNEQWIEKWDGQLPDYMAGDDSSVILDMSNITTDTE